MCFIAEFFIIMNIKKHPAFEPGAFEKTMERGREPIDRKMAHRLANALGTSYKNLFW